MIGQIIEASNPPEKIDTYVCKKNEVKFFHLKNDVSNGEFSRLYETVGFIVVRIDDDEVFFNYRCNKEKTKILYSYYKCRIPNSFNGTISNRYKEII